MTTTPRQTRPETFSSLYRSVVDNVESVIRGKHDVVQLVVLALIAEGHVLIEDSPGLGKTTLAKALSSSVGGTNGRIQFTPDLLPADVVGVSIWNRGTGEFEFRPGAVFANIVLADEINRASPKTQSALLEAMAERQITVDRTTHRLAIPFMVIATQNPLDHEGTYPLPESQLDRFLMKVSLGYPNREAEMEILDQHSDGVPVENLKSVVSTSDMAMMSDALRSVHVAPELKSYMLDVAAATRSHSGLRLGLSPRAVLSLQKVSRALAAASGRPYVIPDDIKALARAVMAHRLLLTPEAQLSGVTAASIVDDVMSSVPVPTVN
ncbi:MAG: AAA family ATPase [Acidimicrobiales bacterium]